MLGNGMPFAHNPYGAKLKSVYDVLSDPNSTVVDDSNPDGGVFAFSDNDPLKALLAARADANIPEDVCIIGAGVAGLTAAYEFSSIAEEFGKPNKIVVLEKTGRVGGRVLTHRFSANDYAELGPMRLPAYHEIALHYAKQLELEVCIFPTHAKYYFSRIGGTPGRVDARDASLSIADSYMQRFAANPSPGLDSFFQPSAASPIPTIDDMEDEFIKGFTQCPIPERRVVFMDMGVRRTPSSLQIYSTT
jgi:hypothetical protein